MISNAENKGPIVTLWVLVRTAAVVVEGRTRSGEADMRGCIKGWGSAGETTDGGAAGVSVGGGGGVF